MQTFGDAFPARQGQVSDEDLATASLDRLLPKSHVLNIKGRSYWLRELEQAAADQRG